MKSLLLILLVILTPHIAVAELNVRDYGAVGDGVTDDTVAIQSAIAAMGTSGTLYFPRGHYIVSSTLDLTTKKAWQIRGDGLCAGCPDPGTTIRGAIPGTLLRSAATNTGAFRISGVNFRNTSPAGVAVVHVEGFNVGVIESAQITTAGQYGIYAPQNTFGLTIRNVVLNGSGNTGIGAYLGTHAAVYDTQVTGWAEGIRARGNQISVYNSRFEVNRIALNLGYDSTGAASFINRGGLHGLSMEANDYHIILNSPNAFTLSGIGAQGSPNAPSGMSKVGLWIKAGSSILLSGLNIGGAYSDAAIRVVSAQDQSYVFAGVQAGNGIAAAKLWDVQDASGITFINSNYKRRPDDAPSPKYLSSQERVALQSLAAIDYLNPVVEGRNLRGKAIAVSTGATKSVIAFTTEKNAGGSAIIGATPAPGAGLPDGTYYYIASVMTARGELTAFGERSVTLGGGSNQTALTFAGCWTDGFKRRIYRGTATGIYDGYYELPLNVCGPWTDVGAPFTGIKGPAAGNPTGMQEPDANYAVWVSPGWVTTWGITARSTAGFTVEFGTPAPSGAVIDWLIVR